MGKFYTIKNLKLGRRATIGMGIGFFAVIIALLGAYIGLKQGVRTPKEDVANESPAAREKEGAPGLTSHSLGDVWTDPVTGMKLMWIPRALSPWDRKRMRASIRCVP